MVKKYLFICLSFGSVFLFGCSGGNTTVTQTTPSPTHNPCTSYNDLHTFKFQHIYMNQFPLISNNKGALLKNAFLVRAGIIITFNKPAGDSIPQSIINTGDGSRQSITDSLGRFWYNTRHDSVNYPYYVCGIDNLSLNTYKPNAIGASYTDGHWTFVFVGKIKQDPHYVSDWTSAVEGCLTHEMAHQIHIDGHEENCSGADTDKCIMHDHLILNLYYYPYMTFCDHHGCELYYDPPSHLYSHLINNHNVSGGLLDSTNTRLYLSLDKNIYLEAEDIILNVKIKNNGDGVDSIKNLDEYSSTTNINLTNSEGRLRYSGIEMSGSDGEYVRIMPGQEIDYSINLRSTYGSKKQDSEYPSKSTFLSSGLYNVELLLNKKTFGKDLISNSLSFEIKYPSVMEQNALQELRELYQSPASTELSLRYREFVYKYPESAYMDQAFADYLSIRLGGQEKKYWNMIIDDCKWFTENRPNSSYVGLILKNCTELIEKYKSKSDAVEYLNAIVTHNSDKKSGKDAIQLLNKLNK